MVLASTPTVCRITGLSKTQLREWTNRRALIPADLPPAGKGSRAQFLWQTVLVIQIAAVLRKRFHLELQSHQPLFAALREALDRTSFVRLWDMVLVVRCEADWELAPSSVALREDAIVIHLNPHLETLASDFAMTEQDRSYEQLPLFPVQELSSEGLSCTKMQAANSRRSP